MNPIVFLAVPLVVILVVSIGIWLNGRHPQTMNSGIDGFQREMEALSPDTALRKSRRFEAEDPTRSTRPTRGEPARPTRTTRTDSGPGRN